MNSRVAVTDEPSVISGFMRDMVLPFFVWVDVMACLLYTSNITCENEPINLELLAVAQAVKACGGKVIVGVQSLTETGRLNPRMVKVPGIYVDYVVVSTPEDIEKHYDQTGATKFRRDFTPGFRVPVENGKSDLPLNAIKIMCRRAAMELRKGMKVNFGIGNPQSIGTVLAEEGCSDMCTTIYLSLIHI